MRTMCADPSTVELVRDRLVFDDFNQTREIANVFRARAGGGEAIATAMPPNAYPMTTVALGYTGYTAFHQASFLHNGAAPSPTVTAQSGWSSEVVSGEEHEEADFAFEEYPLPEPPSWP